VLTSGAGIGGYLQPESGAAAHVLSYGGGPVDFVCFSTTGVGRRTSRPLAALAVA